MNQEIINVLNRLEMNGFEAFVIGGYVRDKLLGRESYDVDIVTNARPKDIISVFNNQVKTTTDYGTTKISGDNYRFDIATYRKDLSYTGRNPEIEYINNLSDDIIRRDFTINTIAMNKDGEIIDNLNGIKDLQNRLIKSVGNSDKKIKEDPLRILRALRFSIVLDFKLDDNLLISIKNNINLLDTLSNNRVKEEIDKILISDNAIKGFDFLNKLGILKKLNISYKSLVDVDDLLGMYAQIEVGNDYPFTKEEKRNVNLIKNIINYGKIDNTILFNNGLYISLVSAKILELDKEDIVKMYNDLPIKSNKELCIDGDEIMKELNLEPSILIKKIYDILIDKVLNNELKNEKDILISYIKEMYLNEL